MQTCLRLAPRQEPEATLFACLFAVLSTGQNSKPNFVFSLPFCHDHAILLGHVFFNLLAISAVGCIEKELHGLKVGGVSHWISVFARD